LGVSLVATRIALTSPRAVEMPRSIATLTVTPSISNDSFGGRSPGPSVWMSAVNICQPAGTATRTVAKNAATEVLCMTHRRHDPTRYCTIVAALPKIGGGAGSARAADRFALTCSTQLDAPNDCIPI
jgi:hypothetical protein